MSTTNEILFVFVHLRSVLMYLVKISVAYDNMLSPDVLTRKLNFRRKKRQNLVAIFGNKFLVFLT